MQRGHMHTQIDRMYIHSENSSLWCYSASIIGNDLRAKEHCIYRSSLYCLLNRNVPAQRDMTSGVATPGPTRACARVKLAGARVKLMRKTSLSACRY